MNTRFSADGFEINVFHAVRCFSCKGNVTEDVTEFHKEGFLKGGQFHSLLRGDWHDTNFDSARKYYNRYVASSAICRDYHSLISLAKRHIQVLWSRLETPCSPLLREDHCNNSYQMRKDFSCVLHFLKSQLMDSNLDHLLSMNAIASSHLEIHTVNTFECQKQVIHDLKGLALCAGRISSLPESVLQMAPSDKGNLCLSPSHHLFHLYLDFWWSVVEILHRVDFANSNAGSRMAVAFCQNSPPGFENLFSQVVLMLLWDFVFVGSRRFSKMGIADLSRMTPFSCTCMQEMCAMLIQLLNFHHGMQTEEGLWKYLNCIYQEILNEKASGNSTAEDFTHFCLKPSNFTCQDPVQFCLWFITHLTSLFKYDSWGNFMISKKVPSNYLQVQQLVRTGLNSQEQQEDNRLRGILHCCIAISVVWEPSLDLLLPLTEYFLKKLDENFQQTSLGIIGLPLIHQCGKSWIEDIRTKVENCSTWTHSENSFHLFLRLTGHVIKSIFSCGSLQLWKQLKGRIFSKFHRKRVLELHEAGLFNCFSYFLTLACTGNLEEVASKMCELAEILCEPAISPRHQAVVWKAIFALLACYIEKSVDMKVVAIKLAALFTNMNRTYVTAASGSLQRQEISELFHIYTKGIQDIFGSSQTLALSEYELINSSFSHVLSELKPNDVQFSFYNTLDDILSKFCEISKKSCTLSHEVSLDSTIQSHIQQHEALAELLYQEILPHIKKQAVLQQPPYQIADVAVRFTLLALYLPPKINGEMKENFTTLFNYFGFHEKISPSICCHYLSHLVCKRDVADKLKTGFIDFQGLIIRSWLRCGLCILPHSAEMQELSRFIVTLPTMNEIFLSQEFLEESYDHASIMVIYFRLLQDSYESKSTPHEKAIILKKFQSSLQGLVTVATSLVKQGGTKELYHHMYYIIGHLVLYCGPFLYMMSKPDSLLPSLLDGILLPHTLYAKDKQPLLQAIIDGVQSHLPLFIQGIAQLGFSSDPYISRKLKDIFIHYMTLYKMKPLNAGGMNAHPLITSIFEPCPGSRVALQDLQFFVLRILFENCILKKGPTFPLHCSEAIVFIGEIFAQSSVANKARVSEHALPYVLESLISSSDVHARALLVDLTNSILRHCHQTLDDNERSLHILPVLRNFITCHLPWTTSHVFKVLGHIGTQYAAAINDVLPVVHETIQQIEKKRGVDHDPVLREGVKGMLRQLESSGFSAGSSKVQAISHKKS